MNKKLKIALFMAIKAHGNQKRKGTEKPYITHPIAVFNILRGLTSNEDILCAAILHDTLEDTNLKYSEIERLFGKRIASIVLEVTKVDGKDFIKTREGLMVKLADTLHNLHNNKNPEQIQRYIKYWKGAIMKTEPRLHKEHKVINGKKYFKAEITDGAGTHEIWVEKNRKGIK